MTIQPVDITKAYRLLQIGPTTMISAAHAGKENIMAAAWVGLVGNDRVMAYIGKQAFTRQLIEKSGLFAIHIPTVKQMETVLYMGENSALNMKDKLARFDTYYQPGYEMPLLPDSAGWIICRILPNEHNQTEHDLFMGEIIAAWSDDRIFKQGHWEFDEAPGELHTVHYVAGGQFYIMGKGHKFDHGPGKD